ncbi:MAG: NAD-dependent epimerase/dehydratase family protein [Defluviitaleaceae bacterium]|nr:NAD-dependent epimerase/dehydratase family protein [Defluviitaleaceae bacterium]
MKKIMITGEAGYIAQKLQRRLLADGYDAECVSVRGEVLSDLTGYDVIVHCAALVHAKRRDKQEYYKINSELTRRLALEFKRSGGGQFVFLSTMAVFGKDGSLRKREVIGADTPLRPINDYGKSKLAAEEALRQMEDESLSVAILRPPIVYGENCPGNYRMLELAARFAPVFPLVHNQRSMLHVDRLCGIISSIIREDKRGTFHPQDAHYHCTSKIVKRIAASNGRNIALSRMLGKFVCLVNISLIRKVFGNLVYSKTFE